MPSGRAALGGRRASTLRRGAGRCDDLSQSEMFPISGTIALDRGCMTSWPAPLINAAIGSSSFPVCHAPWTSRYVPMMRSLCLHRGELPGRWSRDRPTAWVRRRAVSRSQVGSAKHPAAHPVTARRSPAGV